MAIEPHVTIECLKSRPPITRTSIDGCETSSHAIVGLWVITVASRSSGRWRASCWAVVPPSMMTVCPGRTSMAAARAHRRLALGRDVPANGEVGDRRRRRQRSAVNPLQLALGGELAQVTPDRVVRQVELGGELLGDQLTVARAARRGSAPGVGRSASPCSSRRQSEMHELLDSARTCTILCGMSKPLMILIAGPYRSGTNDEPDRLAANLAALESVSWPIFQAGHVPMIGEWVALPVMRGAGSTGGRRPDLRAGPLPAPPTASSNTAMPCSGCRRLDGRRPGRPDRHRTRPPGVLPARRHPGRHELTLRRLRHTSARTRTTVTEARGVHPPVICDCRFCGADSVPSAS